MRLLSYAVVGALFVTAVAGTLATRASAQTASRWMASLMSDSPSTTPRSTATSSYLQLTEHDSATSFSSLSMLRSEAISSETTYYLVCDAFSGSPYAGDPNIAAIFTPVRL